MRRPPPISTLSPYTPLFRSLWSSIISAVLFHHFCCVCVCVCVTAQLLWAPNDRKPRPPFCSTGLRLWHVCSLPLSLCPTLSLSFSLSLSLSLSHSLSVPLSFSLPLSLCV